MYVVYLQHTHVKAGQVVRAGLVRTADMSVRLDVAKQRAEVVACDMPKSMMITVRHHKRIDEVYIARQGVIE